MSQLLEATHELPVVVIGAGPVGLAALANLLDRGIPAIVLEAASRGRRALPPVRTGPSLFAVEVQPRRADRSTTGGVGIWLDRSRWRRLAARVGNRRARAASVRGTAGGEAGDPLRHRVLSISRHGVDKVTSAGREHCTVRTPGADPRRPTDRFRAASVIDASGTWSSPNPLGGHGLPAEGEQEHRPASSMAFRMCSARIARARRASASLVVGSGHSAADTLLALGAAGAVRGPRTSVGLGSARAEAPARASAAARPTSCRRAANSAVRCRRLATSGHLDIARRLPRHPPTSRRRPRADGRG